jgi:Secretion system C-terminal sorting domain
MNDSRGNWRILIFKSTDNKNFTDFSNKLIENATFSNSAIWDEPISVFDLDNNGKVDILLNDRNKNLRWEWNGVKMVRTNCHNSVKPILNTSKLTFCSTDTLKLSVINSVKKDKYKWFFGAQVDSSNVISKSFTNSFKVQIVKTDSLGCETKSDEFVLTKLDVPKSPNITREGNTTLISSSLSGNHWYLDGSIIKGEVGQKINATVNGLYSVKYTDVNGCLSENSASLYGLITATGLSDKKVIISPNPFEQSIKIEFPEDFGSMVSAKIHDFKGVVVWEKESVRDSEIVDLTSLSVGNYVLNLTSQTNGQVSVVKISKLGR